MKPTLVSLLGQVFPQAHGGGGVAYEVEAFGGGVLWHVEEFCANFCILIDREHISV